ncbi:MAG: hypothetical protein WC307_06455 [Candidatus Nanoarchaeia archaeon]|jgi:hypothetical protein
MSNTKSDLIDIIEKQLNIELDDLEQEAFTEWIDNLIISRGGHV